MTPTSEGVGRDSAPAAFRDLLLQVGELNYTWTNTESLLIHLIAGLAGIDNETSVIVFLTLSTTRARIDLVDRLAKRERVDAATRNRILGLTRELGKLAALRNRYNHCIYSFDQNTGTTRSIMMRIADRKDSIKMGETVELDAAARAEIDDAIRKLGALNRRIWAAITDLGFAA